MFQPTQIDVPHAAPWISSLFAFPHWDNSTAGTVDFKHMLQGSSFFFLLTSFFFISTVNDQTSMQQARECKWDGWTKHRTASHSLPIRSTSIFDCNYLLSRHKTWIRCLAAFSSFETHKGIYQAIPEASGSLNRVFSPITLVETSEHGNLHFNCLIVEGDRERKAHLRG